MSGRGADIGFISVSFIRRSLFLGRLTGCWTGYSKTIRRWEHRGDKNVHLDRQNDDLIHVMFISGDNNDLQSKTIWLLSWMCLWCYLSEGALSEAELANSPDGYCNHRGQGYGPAQTVSPVWVHIAPTGCQGLVVHKRADEANLEEKAENQPNHVRKNKTHWCCSVSPTLHFIKSLTWPWSSSSNPKHLRWLYKYWLKSEWFPQLNSWMPFQIWKIQTQKRTLIFITSFLKI